MRRAVCPRHDAFRPRECSRRLRTPRVVAVGRSSGPRADTVRTFKLRSFLFECLKDFLDFLMARREPDATYKRTLRKIINQGKFTLACRLKSYSPLYVDPSLVPRLSRNRVILTRLGRGLREGVMDAVVRRAFESTRLRRTQARFCVRAEGPPVKMPSPRSLAKGQRGVITHIF